MGFLKKKPSISLPNGSLRTASSKPSPANIGGPPPASFANSSALEDERRDDGSKGSGSGFWPDTESRVGASSKGAATASVTPSRASAASTKEARGEKQSSKTSSKKETSSGASAGPKPKKKPSSSSGSKQQQQAGAVKNGSGDQQRKSRSGTGAASPKEPPGSKKLGLKKSITGPSDKKKPVRSRHSLSPGRRRGGKTGEAGGKGKLEKKPTKEKTPTKERSSKEKKTPAKSGRASIKTDKTPRVSNHRSSSRTPNSKQPSSSAKKQRTPSRPRDTSRGASRGRASSTRRTGSPKAPISTPPNRRHRGSGRRTLKQRMEDDSSSDESSCSSGTYSEDESSYYSDTEMEDETLCTDTSGEFVSIGCDGTEDSISFTEDEESETDVSRADSRSTYESFETHEEPSAVDDTMNTTRSTNGKSAKSGRGSLLSAKLGKATRENALSTLGNIAANARKEKKEKKEKQEPSIKVEDADANITADAASPKSITSGGEETVLSDIEDKSSKDDETNGKSTVGTASHPSAQSNASTMPDFMKKMEEFKVTNEESQLVVQVVEHGNVEKLLLQELSFIPKPNTPNEIVIKVEASTITLQDCMIRRGKWYEMQRLPFVPGSDFVGTIHSMGNEATKNSTFQVGDKVAAVVASGGNAKYISMPYQNIIRVPQEADSVVALCLSSAYVPAREALDMARKLNTPFTSANILIIGGNGPSGLATIELALLEGANVYTTADERHHEFLTNLGAKCFPIDPNKWLPTLQGKMDVVLDSVCLDGYESSSLALNSAGTLVCTGMSAVYTQGQIRAFGMRDVRDYKATYCKMRAKYMLNNTVYYDRIERYDLAPNEYAQHFRYLCHLAAKGSITPLVSARAPLNLVASLQKAIEHGDTTYGVCVCTPWTTKSDEEVIEDPKSTVTTSAC